MSLYVELRAHSAFSFGDGASTPEALVRAAAERGYGALGLTDRVDLGGVIRFTLEAGRAGIRPVVGAELVVDGHPVALLARDARGFRNLAGLVTRSRVGDWGTWLGEKDALEAGYASSSSSATSGGGLRVDRDGRVRTRATAVTPRRKPSSFSSGTPPPASMSKSMSDLPPRGQPGLTLSDLEGRTEGLHLLTGPATGELASLIRSGRPEEAVFLVSRLRELFPGRLAVEVGLHHVSGGESALAGSLIRLAEGHGLPWVVANDPRYVDVGGRLVHDLLTALRAGLDMDTAASWGVLHPNGEWRLKSPEEMTRLWKGRESGLVESARIAEECAFDLSWVRPPLPRFPVPAGHDDASWLRELTFRGARERWGQVDDRQRTQLEHELGVITRLGFAGFFLVMWDAVREARSRGILCQGRGSAANSAVAFCLGITAVDPIRHGLLFERFLSEVRTDGLTEAPDIDVDFEMHRREEILDYMYSRYGRAHAALTAVTQVYHAPTAIQDCMRALGWPAESAFPLSKRLHGREPGQAAEELEAGLAARYGVDVASPRGRALLSALRALDDVPRLRSTHPGGFVLSSRLLGDYLPIEETTMGRTILQFDKDDLDAAGVPKFDFLGLGGLTVVHMAFDAIRERTGRDLELYTLPVDDSATYRMISRGDTLGTFQIESRAQIQSILQTRPSRLYDIVVQVALIRPGPIQARFVRPYTRRRLGLEVVGYADPRLEPILRRTYGIPIFQEQAMAISMALGGFSAAEADELRRAMGHQRKLPRLRAALERLEARMIVNGVDSESAAGIVEDLHSFANYGFPESHAWSFALIAYATAYLKAHYPADFLMALLNAWPMGFYPPATLVHEARRNGVVVRPPCLRHGTWECTLEPAPVHPAVRIGWKHIRGLGEAARDRLQSATAAGPFGSVADVVCRASLSRADALHLARAGAFEAFEPGRRRATWEALRAAGDTLPLAPTRHLPFDPREMEDQERIFLDYLATGICVDGHPMEHIRPRLRHHGVSGSADLDALSDGSPLVVAGLVVVRQHPATARGTVFLLLEDEHGFINVIVPPPVYQRHRETLHHSPFLLVQGRFERPDRAMNVVATRFRELSARAPTPAGPPGRPDAG
jgi:error-prone DNA polymerase